MLGALEIIVPVTIGLLFFGMIFGFLGWLRWMHFREMTALAERGYAPADAPNGTNRMLRWSLVLIALGLAFSCGIAPIALENVRSFPALIPGLSMLFLGLAFLLYWLITGGRTHLTERFGHALAVQVPAAPEPPAAWSFDAQADDAASPATTEDAPPN